MKAKKVYEFRTSGEIVKMGNDVLLEKIFNNWVKENKLADIYEIKNKEYEIKDNVIYFYFSLRLGYQYITEIPFNLIAVDSHVYFYNTEFTKTPYLKYNITCDKLDLKQTNTKKIYGDITCDIFDIRNNTSLKEINGKLKVNKKLILKNSNLLKFPEKLECGEQCIIEMNLKEDVPYNIPEKFNKHIVNYE